MNVKEICINSDITIKEGIKVLDATAKKIILVVNGEELIGVVTDGDIRRWILKNGDLKENITAIMNTSPVFLYEQDKTEAFKVMKRRSIEAIPILNRQKHIKDIIFWNQSLQDKVSKNKIVDTPVVIMAGGKGTRLYPYTKILPKPLIPIGDLSIMERIINQFTLFGIKEFYATVNYKKNMIKAYFEEVDKDYTLSYVEEDNFLGTAGSLNLLRNRIDKTFFVSNCDILVEADYLDILNYHKSQKNKITMVTSLKNYTIPYGVIDINKKGYITQIREKPEFDFQVNTGLYVLEPEVLKDIPKDTYFHITELINYYIEQGETIGVYPVTENAWLDMGELKEMQKMTERLGL